jgi:hypothetical protein
MNDTELQAIRDRATNVIGRGPDWDDFEALQAEVDRLRGIEDKALAQSEYIQTHGLTEYEQARLQAEVDRLRAALTTAEEYMSDSGAAAFRRATLVLQP